MVSRLHFPSQDDFAEREKRVNLVSFSLFQNLNNYLKNQDIIDWVIQNGRRENELHLAVSIRSFRAEKLSQFVKVDFFVKSYS